MKSNAVLAATIATLLASQTAAAAPRQAVQSSESAAASKPAVGGSAKRVKRARPPAKIGASRIKAPQGTAQAPESNARRSTMVGGPKGAALVAAAVAQGAGASDFGDRWEVYDLSSSGLVTSSEIWVIEKHVKSDSPRGAGVSTKYVFKRPMFSKTFSLKETSRNGRGRFPGSSQSPGPAGSFQVVKAKPGESIADKYARARAQAQWTNTPVVMRMNDYLMTVDADSPADFDAFEASGKTLEISKDF